jgi:hypothetical protein
MLFRGFAELELQAQRPRAAMHVLCAAMEAGFVEETVCVVRGARDNSLVTYLGFFPCSSAMCSYFS